MGFFSWNCAHCGHPLLPPMVTNEINRWMNSCVAIMCDNSRIAGSYDGYGRIGGELIVDDVHGPQCYHEACWRLIGCPSNYTTPSRHSEDQGYFFDEGAHDLAEPALPDPGGYQKPAEKRYPEGPTSAPRGIAPRARRPS
jgi:hypothetical protein